MSSDVDGSNNSSTEKTFVLPNKIEFGYQRERSHQVIISESGLKAEKRDPSLHYAHGVVYGTTKLKGTVEFEVKILTYGTGWSGTLKLGVMRCKSGTDLDSYQIPRYSPEGPDHCVWSSDKIHNRLKGHLETFYGKENLDNLREGDRLGMRLTSDGVLVFFVNGKSQGVAAENVYEKGYDVYPVVDHYANCKSTEITKAGWLVEYYSSRLFYA